MNTTHPATETSHLESHPHNVQNYLSSLKVGDMVATSRSGSWSYETVTRVTKAEITLGYTTYWRTGPNAGKKKGEAGSWKARRIIDPKEVERRIEAAHAEAERENARLAFDRQVVRLIRLTEDVPFEQRTQVYAHLAAELKELVDRNTPPQ